ncbi:hypothetical protein IscW_ISCW006358, partial [Ixodes scapularis]
MPVRSQPVTERTLKTSSSSDKWRQSTSDTRDDGTRCRVVPRSGCRTTETGVSRGSASHWPSDGEMVDFDRRYGRRVEQLSHGAAVGCCSLAGMAADGETRAMQKPGLATLRCEVAREKIPKPRSQEKDPEHLWPLRPRNGWTARRREEQRQNELDVGCVKIPEGVSIIIPTYLLHHDPELWQDPTSFNPERFCPEHFEHEDAGAFQPFGAGPRNCFAMAFSKNVIMLLTAKVIAKYRLVLTQSDHE